MVPSGTDDAFMWKEGSARPVESGREAEGELQCALRRIMVRQQ